MEVKFFLKQKEAPESPVYARITLGSVQFKYYLKEKINPKHWNQQKQVGQPLKHYVELNNLLETRKQQMKDAHRKYVSLHKTEPDPVALKKAFDEVIRPEVAKKNEEAFSGLFLPFFHNFIEVCRSGARTNAKGNPIVPRTISNYVSTYNALLVFQKTKKRPFRFQDIDLDWYNDFILHQTNTIKSSVNYIGKHIKCIKAVLNDATERGINQHVYFKRKSFKRPSEETTAIYLNEDELNELVALDLSSMPRLDRVRDLFLIGCYTGLRYADWDKVSANDIQDGYIQILPDKTKTPIVIPVHSTVARILAKYDGNLPKKPSNQKINDYLKEIGEKLKTLRKKERKHITKGGISLQMNIEKWKMLTTHVARRSFATNQYHAGLSAITIMAITGHKTEREFLRYIRATPKEHAQLMKLHWEKDHQSRVISLR